MLKDLQKHLLATVPGLREKGISRTTVHQLLLPPRQKSLNAARYSGVIPSRVPGEGNEQAAHNHHHVHHCAAQVSVCMEFAAAFNDELFAFSCDDMNKINIGAMAVSCYHQIRRFFLRDDEPNYPDHDFPLPDHKVILSGYMWLQHMIATHPERRTVCSQSVEHCRTSRKTGTRRSTSEPPPCRKREIATETTSRM